MRSGFGNNQAAFARKRYSLVMHLPRSSQLTSRLEWRESAGSTNLELIQLAGSEVLPDFTVYVTANQMAGRGRSGRVWETPANSALAISVLIHPPISSGSDLGKLGWLPLIAGLAMSNAVKALIGDGQKTIGLKWPNDVLVNERKICGVLTELVGNSVVIGAGINLTQTQEQLPIPNATSLAIEGAAGFSGQDLNIDGPAGIFDTVLSNYLENLKELYTRFANLGMDAVASGVRQQVIDGCITLGREVRAELPGGDTRLGKAVAIDDSGRLVLQVEESNAVTNAPPAKSLLAVSAGDIVHLRH